MTIKAFTEATAFDGTGAKPVSGSSLHLCSKGFAVEVEGGI